MDARDILIISIGLRRSIDTRRFSSVNEEIRAVVDLVDHAANSLPIACVLSHELLLIRAKALTGKPLQALCLLETVLLDEADDRQQIATFRPARSVR